MQPAGEQSFVSRHFLLSTKTAVIVSLIRVRVNVKEFSSGSSSRHQMPAGFHPRTYLYP
jgi:hypothetical protein